MDVLPERLQVVVKMVFGSQRKLAEAIGVHETSVSYWLNGQRTPTAEAVKKIEELGINPQFLSGESNQMFNSSPNGITLAVKFPGGYDAWINLQSTRQKLEEDLVKASTELLGRSGGKTEPFFRPGPKPNTRLSPDIDRITVDQPTDKDVVIPMLESSIPAGERVPIYEDLATSFNVTTYYKNCFTMRVRGDSMIDAGILDGDRVIIKRGHRFRNGDVIAAVVDGEITLKGVWTEDSKVLLVPANPKYPVFEVPESAEFQSLGVCVDTFRPPKKVERRTK